MRVALAALIALLLLASGCGSNGEEAETTAARDTTEPADAVLGDYEREMTQEDIERTAETRRKGEQTPNPGTVRLVVRDGVMQVFVPEGFSISQELTITADEWRIGPYIGSGMDAFCPTGDRPATYAWELEDNELMLTPKDEGCADRDSTLTGTWAKTG